MIVTAEDGTRWATVPQAARAVRVRPQTIRVWAHRGKVRSESVAGERWVCLDDVTDAERDWRRRVRADIRGHGVI